jgi:hypothetical protein
VAPVPRPQLRIGDRILVNQSAGFHRGARGAVVETPPGRDHYPGCLWVLRDGAGSAVWYHRMELDRDPNWTPPRPVEPMESELRILGWVEEVLGIPRRDWGGVEAGELVRAFRRAIREEDRK